MNTLLANYKKELTSNDARIKDVLELLQEAQLQYLDRFLDIGMGQGEVLKWLSTKGKKCTGTGLKIESYGIDKEIYKKNYNIDIIECSAEKMPFENNYFDAVIMSHVLEHCSNTALILAEVRRVLSDNGWLFIFVPPHDNMIYAGHINTGWNIGQLMYVLLMNGFNVSHGRFIKYNYNVCGFVQKETMQLPVLRYDRGDIAILHNEGFFPLPIITTNNENDTYFGNLNSVNWDENSAVLNKLKHPPEISSRIKHLIKFFILALFRLLPCKAKVSISRYFMQLGHFMEYELYHPKDNYNPKNLKGF